MVRKILGMIKRNPFVAEKNLDVILIGENHTDLGQAYEIAKIIEKYKPEYVLYEGFGKKNIPVFLENKEIISLSLQKLFEKYGISLKNSGFTEEVLNKEKLKEQLLKVINYTKKAINYTRFEKIYLYYANIDLKYLPDTYEEIINRPLFTYNPAILNYFIEILNKKLGELEKEILNKKYHNYIELYSRLNSIKNILKNIKFYSESFRNSLDLSIRIFTILPSIYKVGAKMGKCDLDFEERDKKLEEYLEGKISWENFNNPREKAMADYIEKYVKKRQTRSPIIAIVGKRHVKNVADLLKNRGIRYKAIELEDTIKDTEIRSYIKQLYFNYTFGEKLEKLL